MNKLMKTAAWVTAPKLMFAAKNPKKTAFLKATEWAADRVIPSRRRRPSTAQTAAKGLAAAAVALPLGLWVGRKVRGRSPQPQTEAR